MSKQIHPVHQLLELHSLEYVTYQWDGSKPQAQVVIRELQTELRMRSALLLSAHVELHTGRTSSVELRLEIERKLDGRILQAHLSTFDWLIISLHEGRVFEVNVVPGPVGDAMFRRPSNVVKLSLGEPMQLPSA